MSKSCPDCIWHRKVWTAKLGQDAYCLHPRSIDPRDGVAHLVRSAREVGMACGPSVDLHSTNESRTGHMSVEQWRRTH